MRDIDCYYTQNALHSLLLHLERETFAARAQKQAQNAVKHWSADQKLLTRVGNASKC